MNNRTYPQEDITEHPEGYNDHDQIIYNTFSRGGRQHTNSLGSNDTTNTVLVVECAQIEEIGRYVEGLTIEAEPNGWDGIARDSIISITESC
jgi:hypothetical protein